MSFDHLDLEFDDEDETKKKKVEAVHQDVDLEFGGNEGTKPHILQGGKAPAPAGSSKMSELSQSGGTQSRILHQTSSRTQGSSALKMESTQELVIELRDELKRVKEEAEVKVLVAEFKTEYLSDMMSSMKLIEYQIGQLLIRIHSKHPDMKNEVLMIKKILADFNGKKRK